MFAGQITVAKITKHCVGHIEGQGEGWGLAAMLGRIILHLFGMCSGVELFTMTGSGTGATPCRMKAACEVGMTEAGALVGFGGRVTVLRDSPPTTVAVLDMKGQQAHLKTPAMVGVPMPGGGVHGLHGWEATGWIVLDLSEDGIRSPHCINDLLHRAINTLCKQPLFVLRARNRKMAHCQPQTGSTLHHITGIPRWGGGLEPV
jgi:hypothetical protein